MTEAVVRLKGFEGLVSGGSDADGKVGPDCRVIKESMPTELDWDAEKKKKEEEINLISRILAM